MKTLELRNLAQGLKKEITIGESFSEVLAEWKKRFIEMNGKEPTEIEIFYAGYILSNPNVKILFKAKKLEKEITYEDYFGNS